MKNLTEWFIIVWVCTVNNFVEKFNLVFVLLFSTAKRFSCSPCDLQFSDEGTFKKHMKNKHIDRSVKKKWVCTECDLSFHWKSHRQLHLLTYSKVKPHNFNIISTTF